MYIIDWAMEIVAMLQFSISPVTFLRCYFCFVFDLLFCTVHICGKTSVFTSDGSQQLPPTTILFLLLIGALSN